MGLFGGHDPRARRYDPASIQGATMGGYGGGTFTVGGGPLPQQAPAKRKHNWGGIAADFLVGLAGQPGPYAASLQQQQEAEDEEARSQRDRQARRDDWLFQQQWQQEHPAPTNNDTERDYGFISEHLGPGAADNYLRNLGDPMVTVQLPGNRVYSGPRSAMGQALGGGAQASGGDDTPTIEDGYQYTPGPGGRANQSNWTITGGAATPAPPPFFGASRFVPPQRLTHGSMTSGRRTTEGNRLVGGVPGSGHLRGTDADYDGPDLDALLAEVRQLPGHRKSFIHNDHVHSSGDWDVPYYGRRGTTGLRTR